jgi:DNA invertase Pin-like site-specific DNA recombinase
VRPKRKGGIPLDQLLAAHSAGDARLERFLVERYGRDVIPATATAPAKASTKPKPASTRAKRSKTNPKKALGARLSPPDDSQVIEARSPRLVGYARVSTDEQTTALQLDALRGAGCAVIHEDAASGALRSRPGLDRALSDLAPGDTLVVWRLDRLGRSLRALLDVAEMLRERGVSLRSLTEQIDTGTAAGKMLYAVLGAVAQFERDVIRERTVAGLVAAKDRGERLGRRPALAPVQRREAQIMLDRGESVAHVARALRVGRSTIYRAIATE